jgi:predicted protein tyrosine phosphatase
MPDDLLSFPLTVCGIDELPDHAESGVSHIISIIDPDWPDPEHFQHYPPHSRIVWRFHDIIGPRPGQSPPQAEDIDALLAYGRQLRSEPVRHLLIHCHMGISRSTAAAVILMAQHQPGRDEACFAALRQVRVYSWPNSRMIRLADAALGRGGALIAAMAEHHALMAQARPEMMEYLRAGERAAEVPPR